MFAKGSSRSKVFHLLYERGSASKHMIAHELGMSLPTVTKALAALAEEGLVVHGERYPSTGGRPATAYKLRPDARIAIGVELVAHMVRLAAVDLYGKTIATRDVALPFCHDAAYFDQVASLIQSMCSAVGNTSHALIGTTLAIQGLVDADGHLSFGGLLGAGSVNVSIDDFAQRINAPLQLIHDAEAAAYAELWRHRELHDFVYLSLNDHLGSALVLNDKLLEGGALGAGIVEHMVLHPGGLPCYCGNCGCAETTLGASSLERTAKLPLDEFFARMRAGDGHLARIWEAYLDDLALLIHNVRMVACCDVIVGGRLAKHLTATDMRLLQSKAMGQGALATTPFRLARGQYGDRATVTGAALLPITDYLASV